MSWLEQIGRRTGTSVEKGRKYFERGAVRRLEGDSISANAEVQGTSLYDVELKVEERGVAFTCTCPYYFDTSLDCKHVWATIFASDHRGLLNRLTSIPKPRLFPAEDVDPEEDQLREKSSALSPAPADDWRKRIAGLQPVFEVPVIDAPDETEERIVYYVFEYDRCRSSSALFLQLATRRIGKNGPGKLTLLNKSFGSVSRHRNPEDMRIFAMLGGAKGDTGFAPYSYNPDTIPAAYKMTRTIGEVVLPEICATGRCLWFMDRKMEEGTVLAWDGGEPWAFHPEIQNQTEIEAYVIGGSLRRGSQVIAATDPRLVTQDFLIYDGAISRIERTPAFNWLISLRTEKPITVPIQHRRELAAEIGMLAVLPTASVPRELQTPAHAFEGAPKVQIEKKKVAWGDEYLSCTLLFNYFGKWIDLLDSRRVLESPEDGTLWQRDKVAEDAAAEVLQEMGGYKGYDRTWRISPARFAQAAHAMVMAGWTVEAEGKPFRRASRTRVDVRSGIDWFELHAAADFDGIEVPLPELLAAARKGEVLIRLGDGTIGILPEEWLARFGPAVALGSVEAEHLRFNRGQAGLIDALLAAEPDATFDEVFLTIRKELQTFKGVAASEPADSFSGTLRTYQLEGLGWLEFLRRFRFGGCLADDMGLGKTIQVLAHLDKLRAAGTLPPCLVVAPKSLIFNWKQEAARFTPKLRILDYTGAARAKARKEIAECDIVLTTYGTMRKDILLLTEIRFDTIVLDEAQAIKNSSTDAAKASRLLKGDHRLALTGTPVENHIGELWSLFEFLNPGLLGTAAAFRSFEDLQVGDNSDRPQGNILSLAIRPFILRRTKDQVASDLPEKTEQTIVCEMDAKQKKLYNEMRDHYRASLLKRLDEDGLNKSKIHVLEALLRLRQIACHAALVDPDKIRVPSAKLETLIPQLTEVLAEGHKVLVFSQFTQFLAIVKAELDAQKIVHTYLDGKTRDREECVRRFQEDADCRVFLISIKAGGLGLNLTAADYVFILDPWWTPAVEAQAIDRAHRIGQARKVFAYRLITKDTVEERVLELQKSKKELFDAIINMDNSLLRTLTRENLELLLT